MKDRETQKESRCGGQRSLASTAAGIQFTPAPLLGCAMSRRKDKEKEKLKDTRSPSPVVLRGGPGAHRHFHMLSSVASPVVLFYSQLFFAPVGAFHRAMLPRKITRVVEMHPAELCLLADEPQRSRYGRNRTKSTRRTSASTPSSSADPVSSSSF